MSGRPTRRLVIAGAGSVLAFLASGCGFKPLYGTSESGEGTSYDLASVRVEPIPDRIGQILRNELIDRLTSGVGQQKARYALYVELDEISSPLQIQTSDTITRYNLRLTSRFQLVDLETGATVYENRARGVGSYDVVTSEYSTLVAEQATAKAAARELSRTIAGLLSLHFSRAQG